MSDDTTGSRLLAMNRRQAMRRIGGGALGLALTGSATNAATQLATADVQPTGDASFLAEGNSITGHRHHLLTELRNTVSFEDGGQYVHRFYAVGDAVATESDDGDTKVDDIFNHVFAIDASSSNADLFASEDDDETLAYPEPTGSDFGEENAFDDLVLNVASTLNTYVGAAVSGATILENILNIVSNTNDDKEDFYEFLWDWGSEQSDACHHVYFFADHGANESDVNFDLTSKSDAAAINEMFVTLGEEPSVWRGSAGGLGSAFTRDQPPAPEEVRALPPVAEMTAAQKRRYGVRRISTETFRSYFPERETDPSSPKYVVKNYPVRIWDANEVDV